MTETMERTVVRIDQKLSDIKERVTRIEAHVEKTNGSVAKCMKDIEISKEKHDSCPARINFTQVKRSDWIKIISTAIIVVVINQLASHIFV